MSTSGLGAGRDGFVVVGASDWMSDTATGESEDGVGDLGFMMASASATIPPSTAAAEATAGVAVALC